MNPYGLSPDVLKQMLAAGWDANAGTPDQEQILKALPMAVKPEGEKRRRYLTVEKTRKGYTARYPGIVTQKGSTSANALGRLWTLLQTLENVKFFS